MAKDIDDGVGPFITAAAFTDLDFNGIDEGDRLRLTFSEPIALNVPGPTVADFQLPVAFDTLGPDPAFAMGANTNELDIFLGTRPVLTVPGIFSPQRVGQWSPSGINLAAGFVAGHVTDLAGNSWARSATPVDVGGTDNRRPQLLLARWVDNGPEGVGAGDHLILTFDEIVKVNGFLYTDFHLPCAQNSLGSPVTATPNGPADWTNEITLTLGSGARLIIPGVYTPNVHGVNDPSGIDVSPGMIEGHVWDVYGNTAVNSTVRDITGADGTGPVILASVFWDRDNNGPSQGDILGVAFSKAVQIRSGATPQPDEFALPVTGNSFGTNPAITQGTTSADIRITLGENPVLTIPGVFGPTTNLADPASPSGIRTTGKPTGAIIDYAGNTPMRMDDTAAVDIAPATSVGPTLAAVTIKDGNGNLRLDGGDRMVLTFDRPVALTPAFALADLALGIAGNSFGVGATFEVNAADRRQLFIGLGAGPQFVVEGLWNPLNTTVADPSGVGVRAGQTAITDLGGIPCPGGQILDVADEFNPYVLAATYTDTGNDGLGSLDVVDVLFSEPLQSLGVVATDFALSGPTDSFGTGATFQQAGTGTIRITLGLNPVLTVAGVYPAPGATGIDIATTFNNGHIRDFAQNPAVRTTFKDIAPTDGTPPVVTRAVYGDANGNGLVDFGDTISVFFSKAVVVSGAVRGDFAVTNGSFGAGGNEAVVKGNATNEVVVTLGATPLLNVEGIYPADPTASAVDVGPGYAAGHITTVAGANPVASTPKDIEDLLGPVPVAAVWTDSGADGVNKGDFIILTFNRAIVVPGAVNPGGFFLPVAGDSLGSDPSFAQAGPRDLRITLGTGAKLRISGVFSAGALAQNSPSGLNMALTAQSGITDTGNRPARPAPTPIDIRGADVTPPSLLSAVLNDKDNNGITQGDELTLTFDEPVFMDAALAAGDFLVTNGTLGQGPSFKVSPANNKAIIVTLGMNPALTLFGAGQTAIGRADGTYVPGHLTDLAGNDWPAGTQVGVVAAASENPRLVKATYFDDDNNGLGPGDRLVLRFSVPLVIGGGASVGEFRLPVAGDTFGGSAALQAGATNRDIDLILGTGVKLTIAGTYSPALQTVGSPSGSDVDVSAANITSIGGKPALANAVALDIGSDDATPPAFTSATLAGTGGPNLVKAEGDTVTLTATLDDRSLVPSGITADFRPLGGGASVPAATYLNGTAQWLPIVTGSVRDSVSVDLRAVDVAGNVGTYRARENVIQPVAQAVAEVTPREVLRGIGATTFTLHLKPTIPDYCTGMDSIDLVVPVTGPLDPRYYYADLDVSASTVSVGGESLRVIGSGEPAPGEARVTADPATGRIAVKLGRLVSSFNVPATAIRVTFRARVPQLEDEPEGKVFRVTVDNSANPAAVEAVAGDADGVPGNGDTNVVVAVGIKIVSVEEKFVITPNFWKILFTVKFNANMDIENEPRVTFRTLDSLMNEQSVQQLSYVDSTWMGQTIVPFDRFGFAGRYELVMRDARDYLGAPVNALTVQKAFSPKFLIGSYVMPTDERTLVVAARYLRGATDETLVARPLVSLQQTGTTSASLVDVFETARPDTWLGRYTIDPRFGGKAQIEVQGTLGASGRVVKGTAVAEFSTLYVNASSGGVLLAPDGDLAVAFAPAALSRSAQVTMIPDLSDALPAGVSAAPGFPRRAPSAEELVKAGPVYALHPEGLAAGPGAVARFLSAAGDTEPVGLFRETADGWRFVARVKGGAAAGAIPGLSRLALFRDLRGPKVRMPRDENAEWRDAIPLYAHDAGCGVDVAASRVLVDGRPARLAYDEASGELSVILPANTVQGVHELSGEVVDRLGNATVLGRAPFRAAGFPGFAEATPWPNPASGVSRVRYTLGANAAECTFRIYDGAGRLVYDEKMMPANAALAGTRDTPAWALVDGRGRAVANGTYFFKLTAVGFDGKASVRTGKIAVLR